MRKYGKVDSNHKEIVGGLRRIGATVQSLAPIGGGCPDLVVGYKGKNYLFEVKPKTGKLTADEEEWFASWRGTVYLIRSVEDAMRLFE